MKFLPEERKKRIWSLILLGGSILGIVYFNFLATQTQAPPSTSLVAPPPPPAEGTTPIPLVKKPQAGLLPYGPSIELLILEQEEFQVLRSAPPLSVSAEELGKTDLFTR